MRCENTFSKFAQFPCQMTFENERKSFGQSEKGTTGWMAGEGGGDSYLQTLVVQNTRGVGDDDGDLLGRLSIKPVTFKRGPRILLI